MVPPLAVLFGVLSVIQSQINLQQKVIQNDPRQPMGIADRKSAANEGCDLAGIRVTKWSAKQGMKSHRP